MEETKNLMTGLLEEMNRNRELQQMYAEIGMPGMFGLAILKRLHSRAELAIATGDVIEMVAVFQEMKESK